MKQFFRAVLVLVALSLAFASTEARDRAPSNKPSVQVTPHAPGVVYVMMRTGSSPFGSSGMSPQSAGASTFARAIEQLRATAIVPFDENAPKDAITYNLGIDRMYVIYYSNTAIDADKALEMLLATGEVQCGSVRYLFPLAFTPNDANLSQQYAVTKMHLKAAWDVTTGDSTVLIADVDDGFNTRHEDLKNAIKIGYDVVGNVSSGQKFIPDNDPKPDYPGNSHGSHTGGCIAATGNNGVGIAGSGYGCRLMAIKAAGNDATASISGGYEGIHYAATHGARVINCSWGGQVSGDQTFANTFLIEAEQRNALIVASSGNGDQFGNAVNNDITPFYPCNGPGVLSVGATDQNDLPTSFSNYGKSVGAWAPGRSILSCNYPGSLSTSGYTAEDGTSFSSPLTAGVAGLVVSMHPDWTPHFIARQIHSTVDNVVAPSDRIEYWGRVNAQAALTTPPQPGLVVTTYAIDGVPNDSLRGAGVAHKLTLTLKNIIAAGDNIKVRLVPAAGYNADTTKWTNLGSVGVNVTVSGDLQIVRNGAYSEGLLPVKCELSDGAAYDDIVSVNIPLAQEHGFVVKMKALSGSSLKRVSHTVAWAAFGNEDQTNGTVNYASFARELAGVWSDTTTLNDRSEAPYCVEAWDSLTAWFGTGPKTDVASVIMTTDGGESFSSVDVSDFTPFVNSIHFFDNGGGAPAEGIIIGDPASKSGISPYGIGRTLDGGKTWTHVATSPNSSATSSGFEASWNNSEAWVGNNGWFGTNNSKIWHTTDRGKTWKSAKTNYQHSFSIAFDDDGLHGFACFRPTTSGSSTTGKSGMCRSTDGGVSWKSMTMPVPGMTPGVVTYVPKTDMAIVTGDSGVFRTTDFGATWAPIGIPLTLDAGDAAAISVYRANGQLTISMITSLAGVATYSEPSTDVTPNGSIVFDKTQLQFGSVALGTMHTLPVTVSNTRQDTVTILNVRVTSTSGAFKSVGFLNGTELPVVVAPGASARDTFTFEPSVAGFDTAIATFTLTGSQGTRDTTVTLIGQGMPPAGVASGAQVAFQVWVSPIPARGLANISLSLPTREHVRVALFDAIGRQIATLLDAEAEPGSDLVTFDASSLAAGTYYVVLTPEQGQPITRAVSVEK